MDCNGQPYRVTIIDLKLIKNENYNKKDLEFYI